MSSRTTRSGRTLRDSDVKDYDRPRDRDRVRDGRDRERDRDRDREDRRDSRKRSRSPPRRSSRRSPSPRRRDDGRKDRRRSRSPPRRRSISPSRASNQDKFGGKERIDDTNRSPSRRPRDSNLERSDRMSKREKIKSDTRTDPPLAQPAESNAMDLDIMEDDTDAMALMMGFGGFNTTHGKKVDGNEVGAVNVKKQRTWRQYMNRKGGFNRPLDRIA